MNASNFVLRFALVIAAAAPAQAQVRLDWSTTYSTPGNDTVLVSEIDAAGNVYAAGQSNSTLGLHEGTAFIAAWSASGAPLWSTTFDATLGHSERPSAIAFDGAGGVYVAGLARGASSSVTFAAFLLHIDAAGAITWSVEQPATSNGATIWRVPMVVDAQGRAIVGSRSPSGDVSITAYTPAGAVAWQTTYAGLAGGVDTANNLAVAPNGEIVVIGDVNSTSSTSPGRPVLLRLASNGALLQSLEINIPEVPSGFGVDVEVDTQGRIFVAARSTPGGWLAPHRLALLAFSGQGVLNWVRTIDGPAQGPFGAGGAWPTDLEIDPFGRVVVMGGRAQGDNFGTAIVLAAYDVNGNEAWRTIVNDALGGPALDLFNPVSDLLLDPDGEAITIGNYGPAPAIPDLLQIDACALAVDSQGQKRFGYVYGFPAVADGSHDGGMAGAVGRVGAIVIAGFGHTSVGPTGDDAFIAHFTRTASGFCYGDGSGSACPCSNASVPSERAGCASSIGAGGRLADLGASNLSSDTLAIVGTSMPEAITFYFQGTTGLAGAPFGDGLSCAGGTLIRLGTTYNVAGTSRYPGVGDPPISVRGLVGAPGERTYQALYRNAATFCTAASFNLTNGLRVTWGP